VQLFHHAISGGSAALAGVESAIAAALPLLLLHFIGQQTEQHILPIETRITNSDDAKQILIGQSG
jgi:hypothetical protein